MGNIATLRPILSPMLWNSICHRQARGQARHSWVHGTRSAEWRNSARHQHFAQGQGDLEYPDPARLQDPCPRMVRRTSRREPSTAFPSPTSTLTRPRRSDKDWPLPPGLPVFPEDKRDVFAALRMTSRRSKRSRNPFLDTSRRGNRSGKEASICSRLPKFFPKIVPSTMPPHGSCKTSRGISSPSITTASTIFAMDSCATIHPE